MRKLIPLITCIFICISGNPSTWIRINSSVQTPASVRLVSSSIDRSTVHFSLDGFSLREVLTPRGPAYVVGSGKATPVQVSGAPDVPKLTASLVIPDLASMSIQVVSSSYKDFSGLDIAPSKGVLSRKVDPSSVPFHYGTEYNTDQFFPADLTGLSKPFIARDLRGQTVWVYPFQYNPVTKILRVYYDVTIELFKSAETGSNPLVRVIPRIRINAPFVPVYSKEFLNFLSVNYTPLNDYGNLLVLCYNQFMDAMQPYVKWKNSIGIPTKMMDVAVAGSTAAAIKTYITNYYNAHGLTFVLLVGDAPQIPTNIISSGPSDNAYGYIVGSDHYADAFIGRFSAENVAQVQTQVQRTIDYEKNPQFLTDDWYSTVIGIASDQGPGDDGEYDYQHVRGMQSQLLGYTYTWNPELFDGSQGGNDAPGNPTPAQVATAVNAGGGLILYCGHGSETSWGTSGFSNTNVNQLTNQGKLPFIWSVACVNGAFNTTTCFAEAWLRATQGGQPTGAIAFLGSTINQSWNSPMEGQDAMVDILAETYPDNIKRTFAGISINGCMEMIDAYGLDGQNMADTWTVFGDPSIMVRTANPVAMTVTHDATLLTGATILTVTCNVNGARATASLADTILATGLIVNNTVVLTFPAVLTPNDTVHLVVNAYNYLPSIDDIPVIQPSGPFLTYDNSTVNDTTGNNNHMIDYGEEAFLTVFMMNAGIGSASNVDVTVNTTDPWVIMSDSTEAYGSIAPNQVKAIQDGFKCHTLYSVPDLHLIPFTIHSTDGANTWINNFSITAHAPVLEMGAYQVLDPVGNNNGRLDPGETASIKIYINNNGSSDAFNVNGQLISANPNVTVSSPSTQSFGDLMAGTGAFQLFQVVVSAQAPQGQTASFLLEISAEHGLTATGTFNLVIGKVPVLIVDFDGNANSGPLMKSAVESLGLIADYSNTTIPDTLISQYTAVFVCLGVYPTNHVLDNTEGQKLADFLTAGGRLYMEGGDTWKFDPPTPVHSMFHILGLDDGSNDLDTLNGYTGTFTAGMSFIYYGDNAYIDKIAPQSPAFSIFSNQTPVYVNAVAYDAGTFKTIGSSFEFGGLTDGIYPSTKSYLMEQYLTFFGIQIPSLAANFIGYPTVVNAGGTVEFTDFSTGGVSTHYWTFPGGTPSASTETNPVITYNTPGIYDVELIVSNGNTSDTLLRTAYITTDFPVIITIQPYDQVCSVFPNPNNGRFRMNISGPGDDNINLVIMNSLGSVIYKENNIQVDGQFLREFNLSNQPDGLYFLHVKGNNTSVIRRVIIIK